VTPSEAATPYLNTGLLGSLPSSVAAPSYDRTRLTTGIVHFGLGNFHRSHQAMYLDALLRSGDALGWGICGIGVTPVSATMRDALHPQDLLYTLIVKQPDGAAETRVIGSLNGYLYSRDDPEAAVARIADPATCIVSLTVTEGGYALDDATREFNGEDALVEADLQAQVPSASWVGLLLRAMQKRRAEGVGGLTLLSCDNLEHNGAAARAAFLGFAQAKDPAIVPWLEEAVAFPSSMVDRVTPATTSEDRDYLPRHFGYRDRWPVPCEPFTQWVLEDSFARGRPRLEEVGVQIVADVEPYELMKIRLANATHQALCYFGHLLGHTYVHEAVADADIHALLIRYIDEEAVPTLAPIPDVDPRQWGRTVLARFANPQIRDRLERICEDGSDRIPKFLLPVARFHVRDGGPVATTAAVVASWARYAIGVDEQGQPIEVRDRRRETVMAAARHDAVQPGAFIEDEAMFGDLAESNRFREAYVGAAATLRRDGARALLRAIASGDHSAALAARER